MATRRETLQRLAVGIGLAACGGAYTAPKKNTAYIAIETNASSRLSLASFISASGERIGSLPLDFRAHGIANHKSILAVFPRRPGNRLAIVDSATMLPIDTVTGPVGCHFCGHGAFSLGGNYLLVTENHFDGEFSAIGVYELADKLKRIDQLTLPLPGPHEIVRHPTTDRFFIALGGLLTHPEYGRDPLNLDDFKSQIVEISLASQNVTELGVWENTTGVSLRHLAADNNDRLYVGGQIKNRQIATSENVLWVVENGYERVVEHGRELDGYVSSVSACDEYALVSSKNSHKVLRLDGARLLETTMIDGASSVAAHNRLTAVAGFELLELNGSHVQVLDGYEFDNHGLALA